MLTDIRGRSMFVSQVPMCPRLTSIYVSGRAKGELKMLKLTGPLVRGSARELKLMGKMHSRKLKRKTLRITGM